MCPESALCLHKELLSDTVTSAGGLNFYKRMFGHPLIEVEPDGGFVIETDYFHAHQDVAYPIKGLIILASKRHIKYEITAEEKWII